MNGLEKITGKIAEDSRAASEELLSEARRQAAEITEKYSEQASALAKELSEKSRKAARERGERILGGAEMESKKSVLAAKQELIGEAFSKAREKLADMSGDGKIELLAALAAGASTGGAEQLCLSEKDKGLADEVLARANAKLAQKGKKAALTLAPQGGSFDGGLILRDGDVTVNCTFDALLHNLRDKMSGEVAGVLFN